MSLLLYLEIRYEYESVGQCRQNVKNGLIDIIVIFCRISRYNQLTIMLDTAQYSANKKASNPTPPLIGVRIVGKAQPIRQREKIVKKFLTEQGRAWQAYAQGQGRVEANTELLRLINTATTTNEYSNAQIDDYAGRPRRTFRWHPPLTLTVQARFSHSAGELRGTAGFGFWNDPFMMTGARRPSLPRAIWFFYSSAASNMPLALGVPGHGWKAATIDTWRLPFFLLAPTAPIAVLLMRIPSFYRRCWPLGQRAINVSEAIIPTPMTEWHTYRLEWGKQIARFYVDNEIILDCTTPPRGPLGLVVWLDNQAMVVTPQGQFRHTLVATETLQWMEVAELDIKMMSDE